jgi:vanillate/3-O-methylgallate O-demethylase
MGTVAKATSLQQLLDSVPSTASYLYNDTTGPHSRAHSSKSPIPPVFTNWHDEQKGWRETAILFDQSHHMPELYVSGPDARALLSSLVINSLENLDTTRAKQIVGCNARGQFIGDSILYDNGNETFEVVSSMPLINWIEYNAQTGGWDVTTERDNNTSDNTTGRRRNFRYSLDGPKAGEIFDEIVDGGAPEIAFFRIVHLTISGIPVRILRHGMAAGHGVEILGDFEHGDAIRDIILAAGEKYGLIRGGTTTYFSAMYENPWLAYQLPAIYTGDELRAYREWLPADSWEAKFQLGGSYFSDNIEDYYVTPYDLGYGRLIKFDHDFVGREALEELANKPSRTKMSLVWNVDDVLGIFRSLFEEGELPYKYLDLPVSDYSGFMQRDEVRDADGQFLGFSTFAGYSSNERKFISIGLLDPDIAKEGDEVVLLWGEPNGGSRKPRVERHRQVSVRATVAPAPYWVEARKIKTATVVGSAAK